MRIYRTVVRVPWGQQPPVGFRWYSARHMDRTPRGIFDLWQWFYLSTELAQERVRAEGLSKTYKHVEIQMADTPRLTGSLLIQLMNGGCPPLRWSLERRWNPEMAEVT